MAKCWEATVVAVAVLVCIVGLEAQDPLQMAKGSKPAPQPDPPRWYPPNHPQNPSRVFSQRTPQTYPGNAQLSQGLPQTNPQPYPGNAQWTPPITLATPAPLKFVSQWVPDANPVAFAGSSQWSQLESPNVGPQVYPQRNPQSSSQVRRQWTPPKYPENLPSSHVFSQQKPQRYPENLPPSQQINPQMYSTTPELSQGSHQWTKLESQPANPSQARHQWNPLLSQDGHQWNPPENLQNSPPSQVNPKFNPQEFPRNPQWSTAGLTNLDFTGKPAVKPPSYQQGSKNPQTPMQPPVLSCDVSADVRVPCGPPAISAAGCQAISCCFDGQNCYFGKAVTVQCTKDGQFIVVVAKDATLPTIDVTSTSLLETDQGCTYVDSNSQFAIYQFPVTQCGSHVTEDSSAIIYENRLSCSYEVGVGPFGAITRDSQFELLFQCKYSGTSVETVIVEVVKLDSPIQPIAALGPINVELRLANGQCQTKGCNEVDAAYTSFYTDTDYPVTKVLRDPVYVEVQLTGKTDPLLVLRLGRCWVTTSPNPHSLPQWDILIDGCPYKDDRYLSSLVPVGSSSRLDCPTHYRRFFFKMFSFVDTSTLSPTTQQIYIHCSTDVCDAKPGQSCEPSCNRQRRDVDAVVKENAEPKAVGSVGPLVISRPEE